MGTDNGNLSRALDLVQKELKKIKEVPMGTLQLSQAKKQLVGQFAIAYESNLSRMLTFGKAFLHDNNVEGMDEIKSRIESISASDIQEVAREVLASGQMSSVVFRNGG
jgi:predicted Zn-dependent peptidase